MDASMPPFDSGPDPEVHEFLVFFRTWIKGQGVQSWLQMVLSLLLGWVLGQLSLQYLVSLIASHR